MNIEFDEYHWTQGILLRQTVWSCSLCILGIEANFVLVWFCLLGLPHVVESVSGFSLTRSQGIVMNKMFVWETSGSHLCFLQMMWLYFDLQFEVKRFTANEKQVRWNPTPLSLWVESVCLEGSLVSLLKWSDSLWFKYSGVVFFNLFWSHLNN